MLSSKRARRAARITLFASASYAILALEASAQTAAPPDRAPAAIEAEPHDEVALSVTIPLATANAVGASALGGSSTTVFDTLIDTTSVGANATGQIGLLSSGAGSQLSATQSVVDMRTASGTANNMTGALATQGGLMTLDDVTFNMGGGANALGGRGLVATGAGSEITMTGGAINIANSRGAIAVLAQDQGVITLQDVTVGNLGAQVTSVPPVGSHALVATGQGSSITAINVTASASGAFGNGARAELGGAIQAESSTFTAGAGSVAEFVGAAHAVSGGQLELNEVILNGAAAGNYSHGLLVQGAGSFAQATNSTINAFAGRSAGVYVRNGGEAEITGSIIASALSVGVEVEEGGILTLTDSQVSTVINAAAGVRARTNAVVTISGGQITTSNVDSAGIVASGGATVTATDLAIITSGNDNSIGALADLAGTITLNGGSITTHGDNVRQASYPHAAAARNPGGLLIANGTSLSTTGDRAAGAVADDGGVVQLTDNAIATSGERSLGLFAVTEQTGEQFVALIEATNISVETQGARSHGASAQARNDISVPLSLITIDGADITTHGEGAQGLRAVLANYGTTPVSGRGEARLIANAVSVETFGTGGHGAFSQDNPTLVMMTNSNVLTHGDLAHGAVASLGGRIVGVDSSIEAEGAGAAALLVLGEGVVSTAHFLGSTLTNANGATIAIGGLGDVSLVNSTIGGSGQWLFVGHVNELPPLTQEQDLLTGNVDLPPDPPPEPEPVELSLLADVDAGLLAEPVPGLANIDMNNSVATGSAITAEGSISNLTMTNGSIWHLTGDSNITNLVNDRSFILFATPTGDPLSIESYLTLTTVNYHGVNGTIGLNTYLGTDGSPSDILVIDGGVGDGDTALVITPSAGGGALTRFDGILVVDDITGNTTTPGAFHLSAPVIAGPYEYTLQRGGVVPNLPGTASDWFLRSTLDCTADNAPSPPCPPDPGPDPEPRPANYRPEVSLYTAIPALAQLYGRAILDNLHTRVGEEEHLRRNRSLDDESDIDGAWWRLIGRSGERDGNDGGIYGDAGPAFDYRLYALQGGLDIYRNIDDDGDRDHAGLMFTVGRAEADASHFDGRPVGEDVMDVYSLGAYWTRFDDEGAYFDAVVQASWYDVEARSLRLPALEGDGWGYAASLEIGKPFDLEDQEVTERGWIVEPQAQLIYQHFDRADANDIAARVTFEDTDSLIGRLGVRAAYTLDHQTSDGEIDATFWGRVNVWHEFLDPPETVFESDDGPVPFRAGVGETWFELNGGISTQMDEAATLYFDASYIWDGDDKGHEVGARVGMRWNW